MPAPTFTLATENREHAASVINELFPTEHPIVLSGHAADYRFSVSATDLDELSTVRLRHTLATDVTMGPPLDFLAITVLAGRLVFDSAGETVAMQAGGSARYPSQATLHASFSDVDVAMIRVPWAAMARAAENTGICGADLRFDSMAPVDGAAATRWRRLMAWTHREIAEPDSSLDHSLVAARTVDLIAATALVTFPNTAMTERTPRGRTAVAPAAVRRATAFIDAHAALPITLADIATAAHVGPRALQEAFRRHHGTSPTGYLRRARLDAAHHALQNADPTRGDSVARLAAMWGFPRADRFAAVYRAAFGVPPSHTLRT